MASQEQRDEANGSRPDNNGSALSIKTATGAELVCNDVWTARIMVTAVSGVGMYVAKSLVTFFHENPELFSSTMQLLLRPWGVVTDIMAGSVIVDLDCGSQEKHSKFLKDFDDGKVKEAMEKEFTEIGYDGKLQLTLEKKDVAVMEMR